MLQLVVRMSRVVVVVVVVVGEPKNALVERKKQTTMETQITRCIKGKDGMKSTFSECVQYDNAKQGDSDAIRMRQSKSM
jgi:hypothetical protein